LTSTVEPKLPPLDFDAELVEASVLLAVEATSPGLKAEFRRERDRLYLLPPGERGPSFTKLSEGWFERLGLSLPFYRALREEPRVGPSVSRCLVAPAPSAREEGADLRDAVLAASSKPVLLVRLQTKTLADPARVLAFLRHELLHVADMVDPAFGYERDLPDVEGGPMVERLLRERYRVLWDASVDGRLASRGFLPDRVEEARRREFLGAFPFLRPSPADGFEKIFRGRRPRHQEFLALALEGLSRTGCPLCRSWSVPLSEATPALDLELAGAIRRDFPGWRVEEGLCRQCLDLYAARTTAMGRP
jgi:hypothetical protein